MVEAITNLDLSIMLYVQENLRTGVGNAIMKCITHLGDSACWYLWSSMQSSPILP